MLKIFSTFTIMLIAAALVFGQATVDIPLSGSDGSATIQLSVGLDMAATDCIDPILGESDLPPLPPSGILDIRFLLDASCASNGVLKDYRNAPAFPFTGQVVHTMGVQRSVAGLPLDITYDLPVEAVMTITDNITGTIYTSGPLTGTGTFTINGIGASLTNFWVRMDYNTVPVELTSFTGSVQDNGVLLNWTTATELNNQGFEIERASSSTAPVQEWDKIGYVPGFGTTTEPRAYSYLDNNVSVGKYYYRLKQLDFSGAFEYSPEIEVLVDLTPHSFELSQNYPNPFNPTTTIQFQVPEASDVSIVIYDMLGQEVKSLFAGQVQAGKYTVEWDGSNNAGLKMSSGSYIYRMTAGEFFETKEMILLK